MKRDTIEVYRDAASRWRWRYIAQNGHILADSGQAYSRRVDAVRGAKRVTGSRLTRSARIVFVTGVPAEPWTPQRPTRFEN